MTLVLASRNAGKIAELRTLMAELLPQIRVQSLDDAGITEEIAEDGTTFEENALIKARVAAKGGAIGVADDSGLTVDALGGEPGIWSARYAAKNGVDCDHNDAANNRLLLERLDGIPDSGRSGAFVCAVACVLPDGSEFCVRGEVRGKILREPCGKSGFGYDPLFFYPPMGKTFAQMNAEEKNAISHRGLAMRQFAEELKRRLGAAREEL